MKDYTGIWKSKRNGKWCSKVTHQGTVYNCGQHDTPELAVKARDIRIIEKGLPHPLQILKPKK